MERRLAAILAADVVGYSLLMGEDEAGTLARLKTLRKELVQPKINGCRGRIVKLMGDGLWPSFPVSSRQCAVPSIFNKTWWDARLIFPTSPASGSGSA